MNELMHDADDSTIEPFSSPYVSPTLLSLAKDRRPKHSTVCESCPGSVWFAGRDALTCYCRVMHLKSWTTEEPNTLTHCDGREMAIQAALSAEG